jgi:hypothetical protein
MKLGFLCPRLPVWVHERRSPLDAILSGGPLIANARRTSSALGQSNTVAAIAARVVGAEKEARRPLGDLPCYEHDYSRPIHLRIPSVSHGT